MVTRGLPHNPTTEMDLALWSVADAVRRDRVARETLLGIDARSQLAAGYHDGTLPEALQTGLADVLARFGYRSVGEIDIGVARWSEDPTHLLGAIANHVRLADDALAPDARFAAGTIEAEAMVATLLGRVRRSTAAAAWLLPAPRPGAHGRARGAQSESCRAAAHARRDRSRSRPARDSPRTDG